METLMNENLDNVMDAVEDVADVAVCNGGFAKGFGAGALVGVVGTIGFLKVKKFIAARKAAKINESNDADVTQEETTVVEEDE